MLGSTSGLLRRGIQNACARSNHARKSQTDTWPRQCQGVPADPWHAIGTGSLRKTAPFEESALAEYRDRRFSPSEQSVLPELENLPRVWSEGPACRSRANTLIVAGNSRGHEHLPTINPRRNYRILCCWCLLQLNISQICENSACRLGVFATVQWHLQRCECMPSLPSLSLTVNLGSPVRSHYG